MCRVTVNGKQSALITKLDISATNWDLKFGRVFGKSREAQGVNSGLRVQGTQCRYKTLLEHLRNFALVKFGYNAINFHDLTCEFVQEFDYYLGDDLTLNHHTIWLYMINFTTLCRLAMSRKHLAFNPFSEYKNTKKDKDRGYLL